MTSTVPPGRGLSAFLPRHFVPGYDRPVPPGQNSDAGYGVWHWAAGFAFVPEGTLEVGSAPPGDRERRMRAGLGAIHAPQ
jgi:hypothetical protein